MSSIFRNFFGGGSDRNRLLYDDEEPDYVIDTAASQYIRQPARSSYPVMAPQSLPPHPVSTMDPLVDYREPRIMEARMVDQPRMKPLPAHRPPPMPVEVRHNQHMPPPMPVRQMPPPGVVEHVHRVLEFRVPLCCEGCQERVIKHMRHVRGVESTHCDLNRHKVTVHGYAPPDEVLRALRKQFKRTEFWTPDQATIIVQPGMKPKKVTVVEPTGARHPVNVVAKNEPVALRGVHVH